MALRWHREEYEGVIYDIGEIDGIILELIFYSNYEDKLFNLPIEEFQIEDLITFKGYGVAFDPYFIKKFRFCRDLRVYLFENCYGIELTNWILTYYKNLEILKLKSCQIHIPFPNFITNFSNLKEIDLSFNYITKEIPYDIVNLEKLEILNLESNGLINDIPTSMMNLKKLKILNLSSNILTGELNFLDGSKLLQYSYKSSIIIHFLSELEELNLSYNKLRGQIPKLLFGKITNRTVKNVGKIQITIVGMISLRLMNISVNELEGKIPNEIGKLTTLEILNLSYNQLTDNIPSVIGNLKNLKMLDLSNNQLTGEIPNSLGNLTNLEIMNLSKNQLTGQIPLTFKSLMPKLRILQLNNNNLGGQIPYFLIYQENMEKLSLYGNQFVNMSIKLSSPEYSQFTLDDYRKSQHIRDKYYEKPPNEEYLGLYYE